MTRMRLITAALMLLALATSLMPGRASSYEVWCADDPIVSIGGHLVDIQKKNIFNVDLSKANVITLYLLPELNVRLIPQLQKMKPGSRIVSHEYAMKEDGKEHAKPDETFHITSREDNTEHVIYLWTVPLKLTEEKEEKE